MYKKNYNGIVFAKDEILIESRELSSGLPLYVHVMIVSKVFKIKMIKNVFKGGFKNQLRANILLLNIFLELEYEFVYNNF